jgi:3-oxoacyl-[acyl-carrier protein] reductase
VELNLADQVVLVAGSSRGIGKAIARGFLAERCRTVVTGRDPAALQQTVAACSAEFGAERVHGFAGDLADAGAVARLLSEVKGRWERIHHVVANVGSGKSKPGWEWDANAWTESFQKNLWTSLQIVGAVLPELVERKQGSVTLIGSITGVESTAAPLPYSAAKAALASYAKNLARQLGPHNVRVNVVAPGNILFPGGSWDDHLSKRRETVMDYIEREVPMRRFGQPEEIAAIVVFLASERASFVTGACLVADGGQTRSL